MGKKTNFLMDAHSQVTVQNTAVIITYAVVVKTKVMAPRKVTRAEDEELYRMETDLGWSIVGYSPLHLEVPLASSLSTPGS